jgi:CHASE3 domain sensor protein
MGTGILTALVLTLNGYLLFQQRILMATLEELKQTLADQGATLDTIPPMIQAIADDEKTLADKIAELQAQIDAGGSVDLTEVSDMAKANADKTAAIAAALTAVDDSVPGA